MFNSQQMYVIELGLTLVIIISLCVSAAGLFEFANSRDYAAIAVAAIMAMYAIGVRYLIRGIKKANDNE